MLCCLITLVRLPEAVFDPALRGEDGLFFQDQLDLGFWHAIAKPYQGYSHFWPRLLSWWGDLLPLPPGLTVSGLPPLLLTGASCAWILRGDFAWLGTERARLAVAGWLAAQPVAISIPGAASTGQFYQLWIGFLLLLVPLPRARTGQVGWALGQLMIGATAVGSLAFAPIWLLRVTLCPAQRGLALVGAASPLLQLLIFDWQRILGAGGSSRAFGPQQVLELLVLKVAGGPLLGEAEGPLPPPEPLVWALGALATAALIAAAWATWRSEDARLRGLLILSALALLAYLAVGVGGRPVMLTAPRHTAGRLLFVPAAIVVLVYAVGLTRASSPRWRLVLALPLLPAAWAVLIAFQLTY